VGTSGSERNKMKRTRHSATGSVSFRSVARVKVKLLISALTVARRATVGMNARNRKSMRAWAAGHRRDAAVAAAAAGASCVARLVTLRETAPIEILGSAAVPRQHRWGVVECEDVAARVGVPGGGVLAEAVAVTWVDSDACVEAVGRKIVGRATTIEIATGVPVRVTVTVTEIETETETEIGIGIGTAAIDGGVLAKVP
jgi:hypothetical protein